jgi:hypothetical protein
MTPRAMAEHLEREMGLDPGVFGCNNVDGGVQVHEVWKWLALVRCLGCNKTVQRRAEVVESPHVTKALHDNLLGQHIPVDRITALCRACSIERTELLEKIKKLLLPNQDLMDILEVAEEIQDVNLVNGIVLEVVRGLVDAKKGFHEVVLKQRYILDFPDTYFFLKKKKTSSNAWVIHSIIY